MRSWPKAIFPRRGPPVCRPIGRTLSWRFGGGHMWGGHMGPPLQILDHERVLLLRTMDRLLWVDLRKRPYRVWMLKGRDP